VRASTAAIRVGSGAVVVLLGALAAVPAEAAVLCEKGNRVKLRAEACKPKEAQVGDLGADPSGTWRHDAGPLLDETGSRPEFLVFNPDGSGRVNLFDADTGILRCDPLRHVRGLTATVAVEFFEQTRVLRQALDTPDVLRVTESDGGATLFDRATEIDPAFECGTLTVGDRFEGLPRPAGFTGLAFDGSSLWYEEEDTALVHPVDPATGSTGTPLDLGASQFTHVHAMQGSDFWTHCGCGGSQEASRRTSAGAEVDLVETEPLGRDLRVRAIAYDPVGNVLWLHGQDRTGGPSRFLKVNSDAEPDVLLAEPVFDVFMSGLSWDGAALWGVADSSLVRIDPDTAQATASFHIPDASVDWRGVAAVGSELFLLGEVAGRGVLIGVTPATAP
jgi:hypothetical protein